MNGPIITVVGSDGRDTLRNIEGLQFNDRFIDLFPDPNLSSSYFNIIEDSLNPSDSFNVEFSIQNNEAGDASNFDVEFYLSEDSAIGDSNDILLDSYSLDSLNGSTTTEVLTQNLTLPDSNDSFWTVDGTYYVGIVIDSENTISETDENDNDDYEAIEIKTTATLGDYVWEDLNNNGIQDVGEPGLSGVTVSLYNSDNSLADSVTTDTNGSYLFTNIIPGDYYVEFITPSGYTFTTQDQGGDDTKDSDADSITGQTVVTNLIAGNNDLSWDAGFTLVPITGEIQGLKWNDLDGDGTRDAEEPGLTGWTIYLDQNQNGQLDGDELFTTTDASGNYTFADLAPGTYYVAEEMQSDWEQTYPGNITLSSLNLQNQISASTRLAIDKTSNLEIYDSQVLSSTTQWVVGLAVNESPEELSSSLGAINQGATGFIPNTYIFEFSENSNGLQIQDRLSSSSNIDFFFPLIEQQLQKQFIPNDPLFEEQWHLVNTAQTGGTIGADTNIELAWDSVRGTGVVIGIVDDALQYTHPDLNSRYRSDLSYDFYDDDPDPSPVSNQDSHGTAVAGVAAASGNNNIGVSGTAPEASIAGLRLIAGELTDDLMIANALSHRNQDIDIYNNSWKPVNSFSGPGPLTLAAMEDGVTDGRDGLGNIYLFAAGNDRQEGANVNYNGYANSRYTIAVAAIDDNGIQASYSESGAPIIISGYSSNGPGGNPSTKGITTTDLLGSDGSFSGDYTDNGPFGFGGTSSATPLVAGVIALMLEANPNLSWRDVQHILVETAEQNDSSDSDWTTNGAGHLINHKYGFGAIDATAAVNAATSWTAVGQEVSTNSGIINVSGSIPDNNPTGITSTFSISDDINIEWIEVVFDAAHTARGNLEVVLTSPDGTDSILAETHNDSDNNYPSWIFTSARHWGESSLGEWTLKVSDEAFGETGTWNFWELNIYGTSNEANVLGTHTVTLNPDEIITGIDFGNREIDDGIEGTNADDNLNGNQEDDTIRGLDGNDKLYGDSGNDNLNGDDGEDRLYGQDGEDTLNGGNGKDELRGHKDDDLLNGDADNDLLYGQGGNDTLNGGSEQDKLWGGDGDDVLNGGIGQDQLFGEDGNDLLNGGDGRDQLNGGKDDDTLNGDADNDQLNGQDGNDLLNGNVGQDILYGGFGNDILYGEVGKDSLNGDDGNDTLYGGAGDDELKGGKNDDQLFGNEGNDQLSGQADSDTLYGGDGVDSLYGGDGDDQLWGETDNDLLSGQEGNDLLNGGLGDDELLGAIGNDTLTGANASTAGLSEIDTLTGGADADLFVLGDVNGIYYNDNNDIEPGLGDYAVINGFNSSEDVIQLHGLVTDYELGASPAGTPNGTGIFLNNGDNELLGIVTGSLSLDLNSSAFSFV